MDWNYRASFNRIEQGAIFGAQKIDVQWIIRMLL